LRVRYTLERELRRGGMATVHLARDLKHDRPVALKVLHPDLAHALGSERFQREIRFAARLQHHLNQAIDHLARAIEAGWRDLAMLDHGSEFQRYHSDPVLRELRTRVEALPKVPVPAAIEGLASRLGDA